MESAAIHSSEVHEVDSGIPMTFFKGFSTSLSLLQGEFYLSHQASLSLGTRGCNRPTRCSEPLRSKVGGPSKVFAILCGMGPPGDCLLKVGKGRVYS